MDALMSVDLGLIIWSIINFVVLLFLLGKFAFPAIKNALHQREENIQKAIDEANLINEKSQKLLEESQAKFDNAQKEVYDIVKKGKERAEAEITKAAEEADKIKRQKLEEAKKEIERSRDEAIIQLRNEVADLVLMATEKILDQKLDAESHKKLIEDNIEKLPKN